MASNKKTAPSKNPVVEKEAEEEAATFTATKRESGFMFKNSEFGEKNKLLRVGVYIELNRGVQFKPREFCRNFKGHGWKPGDLDADELIAELDSRAADRTKPEVMRYEDRPRPVAQIQLEGELADTREEVARWEAFFEAAAQKDPELLELRKKVMAEG